MLPILALATCVTPGACRRGPAQQASSPNIYFTRVPPADPGGPDTVDMIEGRVIGARPGQRIVLFAKSEIWWVQPADANPFTEVQPDSTWKSSTHLGTEYAAALVDPGYRPPVTSERLPDIGGGVSAVARVDGGQPRPVNHKTINFSGYEWEVRSASSNRGGTDNDYDAGNAWTDSSGALHLRITRKSGKWACAEVNLTRSLGYGLYRFVVHDTSNLEPAAVFTMFTWAGVAQSREMDIEISQWGDPSNQNAQYVVQPYYIPANVERFTVPGGMLTCSFRWQPGNVIFSTARGVERALPGQISRSGLVSQHAFTSGVPASGGESVHIDLYVYANPNHPLRKEAEVVVDKFEFLP